MNTFCDVYDQLAGLFQYPGTDYPQKVSDCRKVLDRASAEAGKLLKAFAHETRHLLTGELEELYTRTFDLNPASTLEVGWHLFGENYGRGEFLVHMRRELRRLGVPESTELPDHLTHVLPVLGRLDPDQAEKLATGFVLPALTKVLAGLAGKDNPFEHLLAAIRAAVSYQLSAVSYQLSAFSSDR